MKTLYSQDWAADSPLAEGSIHIKSNGEIRIHVENTHNYYGLGTFTIEQSEEIYNALRQVFEFKKKENPL